MAEDTGSPAELEIRRATIWCESCGEETPHRILRLDPRRRGVGPPVSGIARCQSCRLTHPFVSIPHRPLLVETVVSDGARSERRTTELEPGATLRIGDTVSSAGTPLRITRLEAKAGVRVRGELPARDLLRIWGSRQVEPMVRVALVEGRRSRTIKVPVSGLPRLEVGATFRLGEASLVVSALRARGRTWRRPGDGFPAEEVSVLYARRIDRPPAGRSRWSTERETPSSRTSSSSRSPRSRSSPGATRTRTRPRARTADGGAAVHRSSSR